MTDYLISATLRSWPEDVSAEDVWETIHHLEEKMAEGMPIERTIYLLKNVLDCYDRSKKAQRYHVSKILFTTNPSPE